MHFVFVKFVYVIHVCICECARNKRVRQTRVCESSTVKRRKKKVLEPSNCVPTIRPTISESLCGKSVKKTRERNAYFFWQSQMGYLS